MRKGPGPTRLGLFLSSPEQAPYQRFVQGRQGHARLTQLAPGLARAVEVAAADHAETEVSGQVKIPARLLGGMLTVVGLDGLVIGATCRPGICEVLGTVYRP